MSFPSPSVTPPTFTTWPSAYFQGITFGPAPFMLRGDGMFQGAWMPNVRTGDTGAPRTNGGYIGLDLLDMRDITLNIDIGGNGNFGSYGSLVGAQEALTEALTPSYSTENPLFFQFSSASPMLVAMVRPRGRDGQLDLAYTLGNLAQKIPLKFHATDPTLYAAGTLDPSVGVPGPLGGFSFLPSGLGFPLSFGGGTEVGVISAVNSGDMPCFPIITFTGPCTYPKLANASISGNPFLQFNLSMNAGDQLIVNTDPKYPSAVYFVAGTSLGSSVLYTLSQSSSWWALPGKTISNLQFSTNDVVSVAGFVTVEYTSAWSAAA